jgi:uroporphyrinogen-III synthase
MVAAEVDARALAGLRIAALSQSAKHLWQEARLRADLVVEGGGAELARAILASDGEHGPVLFPRAVAGRDDLPGILRNAGNTVDVVDAYEMSPWPGLPQLVAEVNAEHFDAVAFTSPKGANALLDAGFSVENMLVGAIGRTTSEALASRGVRVDVLAPTPSHSGLITAMMSLLARQADLK